MKEQNQDGKELETPVEPLVMTGEELRKALGIPEGEAIPVNSEFITGQGPRNSPEYIAAQNPQRFALWKLRMAAFLASPESRRAENCVDALRDMGWKAIEIADAATNPEA